jgi:hypothetical protein
MLDLVETNMRDTGFRDVRGGISYHHNDIFDMSLYKAYSEFERVPISASIPSYDGMGEQQPDIVETMDGYNAVYNQATGRIVPMRPIADSYKLVPHQDMIREQARTIQEHPHFWVDNLKVVDRLFEEGKKAHRTVYFNDFKTDINSRQIDDAVTPRIDIYNSIDMSWAFQVFSGAYRELCRNSLVFGGAKAYHQKHRHTRGLDIRAMIGKAVFSLDMFTNQREKMNNWARTGLNSRDFEHILALSICKKEQPKAEMLQTDEPAVNKSLLNLLVEQYHEEAKELGETVWAGYNALTHWSTHTLETKNAKSNHKQHDVRRTRSDMVREVITSPEWEKLCEVV